MIKFEVIIKEFIRHPPVLEILSVGRNLLISQLAKLALEMSRKAAPSIHAVMLTTQFVTRTSFRQVP